MQLDPELLLLLLLFCMHSLPGRLHFSCCHTSLCKGFECMCAVLHSDWPQGQLQSTATTS